MRCTPTNHLLVDMRHSLRDWSLITGRGAAEREGGGACEVIPLQKGEEAENVLAMLKRGRGGRQSFGVVFMQ